MSPTSEASCNAVVAENGQSQAEYIDIKHLPKLQTLAQTLCILPWRRATQALPVFAIDRRSRSVHLAVAPKRVAFAAEDDETEKSAIVFLREAAASPTC